MGEFAVPKRQWESMERDAVVTVYEESLRAVLYKTEVALEQARNALDSADSIAVLEHKIAFVKSLIDDAAAQQN